MGWLSKVISKGWIRRTQRRVDVSRDSESERKQMWECRESGRWMLQSTGVDDIRRAGWFEMPNFLLHTSSATNKPFPRRLALPGKREGERERKIWGGFLEVGEWYGAVRCGARRQAG